jgi:magnesium chelatase family protein
VLPSVAGAAAAGFGRAVVPPENAAEALLVPGMEVISAPNLGALIGWLRGEPAGATGPAVQVLDSGSGLTPPPTASSTHAGARDLADVVGQPVARKAAEICAAGGHHMLLLGPPGWWQADARNKALFAPTESVPVGPGWG